MFQEIPLPHSSFSLHQLDYTTQGALFPRLTEENYINYLKSFSMVKCTKGGKCPLVFDSFNHKSHISLQCIFLSQDNGIMLPTLPPRTTYRLQSLDVSVFGPFKKCYNEHADLWFGSLIILAKQQHYEIQQNQSDRYIIDHFHPLIL